MPSRYAALLALPGVEAISAQPGHAQRLGDGARHLLRPASRAAIHNVPPRGHVPRLHQRPQTAPRVVVHYFVGDIGADRIGDVVQVIGSHAQSLPDVAFDIPGGGGGKPQDLRAGGQEAHRILDPGVIGAEICAIH